MKKIFLVRHGKSDANNNKRILLHAADHTVQLADLGIEQANKASVFLDGELPFYGKTRMWVAPYTRARQTGKIIYDRVSINRDIDMREHVNLVEQQFGLFDGYLDEELPVVFPMEHAHYKKCEEQNGQFWARMPLGESRFDVALRVHQSFGTFHRDCDRHGIENIIVVSHGVVIRAFVMQWCHKTPEWFNDEPNPRNCSIRLIENGQDKGYIFDPYA